MGYTTSGISGVRFREFDGGLIVRAHSSHTDKVVQCYVGGQLVGWQATPGERVEFVLPMPSANEPVFLLAVDTAEASTDYFDEAFPEAASRGNRIKFAIPRLLSGYLPDDRLLIYRGDAGEGTGEADRLLYDEPYYPGGRRSGGFGFNFGEGGFGWDGKDAVGFGFNFGYGEFGFDCEMIEYETPPLPPGTYPYKVQVRDAAGNVSTAASGTITLNTYPRPARDLTVQSYDSGTDELVLSWTESEDI